MDFTDRVFDKRVHVRLLGDLTEVPGLFNFLKKILPLRPY